MNNGRIKLRMVITILLVVISCMLMAMPALAAGQGNGSGSGGGQNDPLNLVSSTPTDGQKNYPINEAIKLKFNKNVVNMSVKDNNKACFALYNPDGSKVAIDVIMADDQVNPEQNEDISLKPLQELRNGNAYVVKISPQLQAKNGIILGKEIVINFETAATFSDSSPINSEEKEKTAATTAPNTDKQNTNWTYMIVGAVFIAGLGYLYVKKNNKK